MAAQTLSSVTLMVGHREQLLKRKDLGSCPLGTTGNLQYTEKQGGTPRASLLGVLLKDIRCLLAYLAFRLTRPSEQARAQRGAVVQARFNSRILGDLLGSLTAPQDDLKGRSQIIKELARLKKISKGDLTQFWGWRYCLSTYMDELKEADIQALRAGVLGSRRAKLAMLDQISHDKDDPSRKLASEVLGQIEKALDRRLARDCARKALR
ncbi:MAG: hypothetical protein ACN6OD_20375 [Alcaligenes sp.]